jgi:YgiT-type zinc finger domain-containing protein
MKCIVQRCPGEMEQRQIVHTFAHNGNPIVVEDLPAWVCPVCGYTVLDLHVLDILFPWIRKPRRQWDRRLCSACRYL